MQKPVLLGIAVLGLGWLLYSLHPGSRSVGGEEYYQAVDQPGPEGTVPDSDAGAADVHGLATTGGGEAPPAAAPELGAAPARPFEDPAPPEILTVENPTAFPFKRKLTNLQGKALEVVVTGRTASKVQFRRSLDAEPFLIPLADLIGPDRALLESIPVTLDEKGEPLGPRELLAAAAAGTGEDDPGPGTVVPEEPAPDSPAPRTDIVPEEEIVRVSPLSIPKDRLTMLKEELARPLTPAQKKLVEEEIKLEIDKGGGEG